MPRFTQLAAEDKQAIAEWLLNLSEAIPLPQPSVTVVASTPAAATSAPGEKAAASGAPTPTGPPPPTAYLSLCSLCHGNMGQGNIGPSIRGVSNKPNRTLEDLMKMLVDSRQYGLKDPMPAGFPMLSEDDRRQIAEWLVKLK
jgi:cytochrome c553